MVKHKIRKIREKSKSRRYYPNGIPTYATRVSKVKRNLQRFLNSAVFEICIALLILLSVILVFAEFFIPPSSQLDDVLLANDILTWLFVGELSLRWYSSPSKKVFLRNYWIDILAVLPVLRIFRSFRLLRLLRVLRLIRAFMILLRRSGWISRRAERSIGVFAVIILTTIVLIISWTLVLLTIEAPPAETSISMDLFLDRIWSTTFLFISGEILAGLPTSLWARVVEVFVALSGLLLFAFFVGAVSSIMTNYWKTKMDEKDLTIADLNDHTIICGWDRLTAITLAELEMSKELWTKGVVVVAETKANIIADSKVKNSRRLFHVREDFTKMDVLEKVGARKAATAMILSDRDSELTDQVRDARTVLAALTLEKLNPNIFTCAELIDEVNATHLKMAGVEEVVSRTGISAGIFASAVVNRGISTVFSDLLSQKDGAYLRKLDVPIEYVGRTFLEVFDYFKREHEATVIAVDYANKGRDYQEHHINPRNDLVLRKTDKLIVVTTVDSKLNRIVS